MGPVSEDNNYNIRPLQEQDARHILSWRYQQPYHFYNPPTGSNQDYYVEQFLNPELNFHAIVDRADNLVGFCSFGVDGQVPGGDYTEDALDIGLGMKPELTGQGLGKAFFRTILAHTKTLADAEPRVRLTVATFNQRAMRLYRHFGFQEVERFLDTLAGVDYTVMVRET